MLRISGSSHSPSEPIWAVMAMFRHSPNQIASLTQFLPYPKWLWRRVTCTAHCGRHLQYLLLILCYWGTTAKADRGVPHQLRQLPHGLMNRLALAIVQTSTSSLWMMCASRMMWSSLTIARTNSWQIHGCFMYQERYLQKCNCYFCPFLFQIPLEEKRSWYFTMATLHIRWGRDAGMKDILQMSSQRNAKHGQRNI